MTDVQVGSGVDIATCAATGTIDEGQKGLGMYDQTAFAPFRFGPASGFALALIFVVAWLAALTPFWVEQHRQARVGATFNASPERCAERGGELATGPFGGTYCKVALPDAGRTCSDASDCVGGCVAPAKGASRVGLHGTCQAVNVTFGCTSYLRSGLVAETQCVD